MDIAARIASLSLTKRALLELALNERIGASDFMASPLIPRQQQRGKAPLSFAQQRLWFLDQLYPGKADYNLPQLLQLDGPLNIAALCDALNAIVKRHETLRTTFSKQGDETQQHITPELLIELPLLDLRDHHDAEHELQQQIDDEVSRTFDLSSGPLFRTKLFRLSPQQHTLLVTMHHIISDGWSIEIFNRELGLLYNSYCHNRPAALVALPVQYLDYAVWQRQQVDSLQQQLKYWQQQLDGAPQVLALPTDKVRPAVQSFNGKRHNIDLPPQLSDALKRLGQHENATLFMVMLSAYQTLLYRYSGQDDILVGTPIAGRIQTELEPLIGFFVNSLVIRTRFTSELSFRQLLAQVRETALGAFSHQELPFEKLVETLTPRRDTSRNPLFQAMFSLQNDACVLPQMEQLGVSNLELGIDKAKFDLTLFVSESGSGLRATFNYASDLFHDIAIERMAGHYLTLLTAIVQNQDQAIARLPLLTVTEQAQLAQWNDTTTYFPAAESVQHLFEVKVSANSDAIAAIFNNSQISYDALNRRANQLAHHLIKQGVTSGALIGLCLERSIDALVTMVAILKAGGAYVPLDPSYPKERLALMIEDAQLNIVISHSEFVQALPACGFTMIRIDGDWPAIMAERDTNPLLAANGDDFAYIIYTSGSTGKPKGVCVTHKAISRLVLNTDYVSLGTSDTIAHAANIAFDAATFEIWGALLNGCHILIVPKEVVLSPAQFGALLREKAVTTLFLTTALFNQMIHHDSTVFASLKQLLFGGEACDPNQIRACLAGGPPQRLLHVYGPTETTTFATWYEVREVAVDARTVPIGYPITNTMCYILDTNQQPVPVGVLGELYIGGPGVARGYLNQPELSVAKFIANPFNPTADDKLYRTGDLVRYHLDGAIEFIGRIDRQVKLRGFRIELGEIDEILKQHPALHDCLTLLREDTPGDKRLVTYVTARVQQVINEQALRQHLKVRLPDYMIPSAFVIMDEFPLTPNGKVDREALPAPILGFSVECSGGSHNPLEFHLVKIWENLLRRNPIGIHDNFFELGGHSLLAVKLFDQIEKHFGKKLPLDTLWSEGATVHTLACILEQNQSTTLWPELVQIKPGSNQTPLFCIHTMGGNLFHYYELAPALSPQLPVYGLQARGVYGKQIPRDNVADIAADCINAMRQRQPNGPYRIAGFSSGGIVAFEMAQQLHLQGEVVSTLALLDCYAPGVSHKGIFWSQLRRLLTLKDLRHFQEYLYHRILYPPGLRNLRQMHTIGETHRWAHWSYKPKPYPGRIDLFVADESEKRASDPLLGWSKVIKGELVVHSVPGTHGLMVKAPCVDVLAEKLQHILDQDSQ